MAIEYLYRLATSPGWSFSEHTGRLLRCRAQSNMTAEAVVREAAERFRFFWGVIIVVVCAATPLIAFRSQISDLWAGVLGGLGLSLAIYFTNRWLRADWYFSACKDTEEEAHRVKSHLGLQIDDVLRKEDLADLARNVLVEQAKVRLRLEHECREKGVFQLNPREINDPNLQALRCAMETSKETYFRDMLSAFGEFNLLPPEEDPWEEIFTEADIKLQQTGALTEKEETSAAASA